MPGSSRADTARTRDRREASPPTSLHPQGGHARVVRSADTTPDAPTLQALVTGVRPDAYGPPRSEILRLQRTAGNRATTGLVAQRIVVTASQRAEMDLGKDFDTKPDAAKIAIIGRVTAEGKASAMLHGWSKLSDPVGQARTHGALFEQGAKLDKSLLDLAAFQPLRAKFRKDVEALALGNLAANRDQILGEMKRTGAAAEANGEETTTEQDQGVQHFQSKVVPEIERIRDAKTKMRGTAVGYRYGGLDRQLGEPQRFVKYFDPASPPDEHVAPFVTWEEVNKEWTRTVAAEAALVKNSPSAAFFLGGGGGDVGSLKNPSELRAARSAIGNALKDLSAKIDKAVPLIGSSITFLDMPPLQQQLLVGIAGASGTNWSRPFEKALATAEIKDATVDNLLKTLGLATLSAAFFIFANIATAGGATALGTFLFAGGAIASGTQAALDWSKYSDLSTVQASTTDPELALVSGAQVDEAMIGAILDSVFAVIDVWQGVKGAVTAAKAGQKTKMLLEAGEAGALTTARAGLQTLGRAGVNDAEVIGRAITELGPAEVRRLTMMSYEDLAKKVGPGSPLGLRLAELGEKGVSASTKALLEKLPNLAALKGDEGAQVLSAAVDTYGAVGTLERVGGWAAIKKTAAMKSGTGGAAALESWRQGLVKELQDYIAKESEGLTSAVRTGTEKASSDADVQVVGSMAGQLQERAEAWLAGRTGRGIEGSKKLLDAEIFVDPFRSHFYDTVKGLDEATRRLIADQMSDLERRLIAGAEIQKAGGIATAEGKKVAEEWASKGVKEPDLKFVPLTPSEQKAAASKIDGMVAKVGELTDPEAKARLAKQIAMQQAYINASHPDAYVGSGVKVWVTGREEDIEKLAKAANMEVEDLLKVTNAQRITAALNEGKWLEAALERLRNPVVNTSEDIGKVAKDVTDIGKHGARGAGQLSKAGAPNANVLDGLFAELTLYKEMPAETVAQMIAEGKLAGIEAEITGILGQLKGATKTAVSGLETELKTFSATAGDMEALRRLMLWQTRYSAMADKGIQATISLVKMIKADVSAKVEASIQEPEPNQSREGQGDESSAATPPAAGTSG